MIFGISAMYSPLWKVSFKHFGQVFIMRPLVIAGQENNTGQCKLVLTYKTVKMGRLRRP